MSNITSYERDSNNYSALFGQFSGTSFTTDPRFADGQLAPLLNPYNFKIRRGFRTYQDALYNLVGADGHLTELDSQNDYPSEERSIATNSAKWRTELGSDENYLFGRFSVDDTSVGGSVCWNSRWAFGRDDDIIQPMNAVGGIVSRGGMGRVYLENYQFAQQLVNFTMGVPDFMEMWKFYSEAVDGNLANDINSGESLNVFRMFGEVAGNVVKLVVCLPIVPYWLMGKAVSAVDNILTNDVITRFYEVKPAMDMYYRTVDAMFNQLCVLMGLTPNSLYAANDNTEGSHSNSQSSSTGEGNPENLPVFMRESGPSIWKLLAKRDYRYHLNNARGGNVADVSEFIMKTREQKWSSESDGLFTFFTRGRNSAGGADKFVSFRINKNVDSTETISNSSGPSTIASTLNSASSAGKDATFSLSGGLDNIFKIPGVGDVLGAVKDVAMGAVNSFGLSSLAAATMTGSGYVDIPDVWQGSSFSRSHSMNFTLRAISGDPISVMQDLYLPLALFLGMACPRSVGKNSYTAPFIIRAYCRGMFSVPIGIIESMTVSRGASEFGYSMNRLPTVINISMTLKDLSPIMHLTMPTIKETLDIFGVNSPAQSYMQTLAAVDPEEMFMFLPKFKQRISTAFGIINSNYFTPEAWGSRAGNLAISRVVGAVLTTSTMTTR